MGETFTHAELLPPGRPIVPEEYSSLAHCDGCGSLVTFTGIVRPIEKDEIIRGLDYEHHPTMALKELRRVLDAALDKFEVSRIVCVHRTGFVPTGEAAVLVLVASKHRGAGFAACEYVLGEMKSTVPIWKSVAETESGVYPPA